MEQKPNLLDQGARRCVGRVISVIKPKTVSQLLKCESGVEINVEIIWVFNY